MPPLAPADGTTTRFVGEPAMDGLSAGDVHPATVDQLEVPEDAYDGAVASGKKKPKGPKLHELVGEYDSRGIGEYLKAHPDQIDVKNTAGDAALHVAAAKGAVIVAQAIDAFEPNHLLNNQLGLPAGFVAAEGKHPNTALFLLERAQATTGLEGVWKSPEDIAGQIDALLEKHENPSKDQIAKLAASLAGITEKSLNAPEEIIKNVTHLEALKGNVIGVKSEGWWQYKFLPQRLRALLTAIATCEMKPPVRQRLLEECSVLLDAVRVSRRLKATRVLDNERVTELGLGLEAKNVVGRLLEPGNTRESYLPLGWQGHAIYMGLTPIDHDDDGNAAVLVRIDNLGAGITKAHDKDEGGLVYSRSFKVPREFLQTAEGREELEAFVKGVLVCKGTPKTKEGDFYAPVARLLTSLRAQYSAEVVDARDGRLPDDAQPKQIAGNCSVENTHRGLRARLGSPKLYEWFRKFEVKLARQLATHYASTERCLKEERHERDQRQLDKILDGDGPWTEAIEKLFTEAAADGHEKDLAAKLSFEKITKVIKAGDDQTFQLLLGHGAKADLQGEQDVTLLHVAAGAGNAACCAALIAAGALVNAMDDAGRTPLFDAIESESSPTVSLLMQHGADADREAKDGSSPKALLQTRLEATAAMSSLLLPPPTAMADSGNRRRAPI